MKLTVLTRAAFICASYFMCLTASHAEPQDIFSYGLQSHGTLYKISQYQVNRADITGSINIDSSSQYKSSDGILFAENVYLEQNKDNSICVDQACKPLKGAAHKLTLPERSLNDLQSFENCENGQQCSNDNKTIFLSDGSVDASQEKIINGRSTFYVKTLETQANAALYLQPGDYWIENAVLGQGTSIVIDTTRSQGSARLFITNSSSFGASINLNAGGNPGSLFLYTQGNIEFKNANVNAYIYGENQVNVAGKSNIVGAINGRHINIKEGSVLVEEINGLKDLEWQGFGMNLLPDSEQAFNFQHICRGYSSMNELPSVAEGSNCVATNNPEKLLSQTGCFRLEQNVAGGTSINPKGEISFASGVIPYAINSPLWSDGAKKSRAMVIPKGSKITIQDNGDWEFPLGSILIKNFEIYGKRVETRFLMRVDDGTVNREGKSVGSWYAYSYEWNEEGSDATLLTGKDALHGKDRWVNNKPYSDEIWRYPSQEHCFACHSGFVKHAPDQTGKNFYKGMIDVNNTNIKTLYGDLFSGLLDFWWKVILHTRYPDMNSKSSGEIATRASLGPETAQLNLSCTDPETGIQLNQFDALKRAGAFTYSSTVTTEAQQVALDQLKIVNPYDTYAPIEDRARSYLYVNCSSCHRGTLDGYGPGGANYDFRVGFDQMKLLKPNSYFFKDWTLGVKDSMLVFPGNPEKSLTSIRLHYQNGGVYPDFGSFVRMPFKSTTKPDNQGIAVIDAWIKSGLGFSQFKDVDGDGYAECLIPGIAQNCLQDDPDRLSSDPAVNFYRVLGR